VELELRHLRLICAVADAGSVTKAAAALGLAQPALTTQLRRIEKILGGELFVRDRRGVRPTPLGDLVLARARVLMPTVSGLRDEAIGLLGAGEPARYRLGATNGPITGGLVQRLRDAHPEGGVSIHSTWSENEVVRMVLDGRLDYALVGACATAVPAAATGLEWRVISVDPVWVLLDERHPMAGRDEVGLADLAAEQWITAPGDGCFNDCFTAACLRAGFAPLMPYEMDAGGVFDLVTGGRAVALCQGTVRSVPGAVAVPLRGSPLSWRHLLGWDPAGPAAGHAAEVTRLAADAYRDIVRRRPLYAAWQAAHPEFGVAPQVTRSPHSH